MTSIEKHDCEQSLTAILERTADWRDKVFDRYPDERNVWASNALRKLAADAANLTDAAWSKLVPYCDSGRWRDAVTETARQIGFSHKSKSFPFFVNNLVAVLSQPTAAN